MLIYFIFKFITKGFYTLFCGESVPILFFLLISIYNPAEYVSLKKRPFKESKNRKRKKRIPRINYNIGRARRGIGSSVGEGTTIASHEDREGDCTKERKIIPLSFI